MRVVIQINTPEELQDLMNHCEEVEQYVNEHIFVDCINWDNVHEMMPMLVYDPHGDEQELVIKSVDEREFLKQIGYVVARWEVMS